MKLTESYMVYMDVIFTGAGRPSEVDREESPLLILGSSFNYLYKHCSLCAPLDSDILEIKA